MIPVGNELKNRCFPSIEPLFTSFPGICMDWGKEAFSTAVEKKNNNTEFSTIVKGGSKKNSNWDSTEFSAIGKGSSEENEIV